MLSVILGIFLCPLASFHIEGDFLLLELLGYVCH